MSTDRVATCLTFLAAAVVLLEDVKSQTIDDIPADAPAAVREAIADTFSKNPQKRWNALNRLDEQENKTAASVPFLIRIIANARSTTKPHIPSMGEAYAARSILEDMGSEVIPVMIEASRSGNKNVRESAVRVLEKFPEDPRVSPVLIALLSDPTRDVRRAAAGSLCHVPSKQATEELIVMLRRKQEDPIVRHVAATSLGRIGSAAAVEPLVDATASDNREVRCGAYNGLSCLRQTDVLLRLFKEGPAIDSVEGEQLIWALARTRDPRAVEALRRLLDDVKNGRPRRINVTSLNALRDAIRYAQGRSLPRRSEPEFPL